MVAAADKIGEIVAQAKNNNFPKDLETFEPKSFHFKLNFSDMINGKEK